MKAEESQHPDHERFLQFCQGEREVVRHIYARNFRTIEKLVTHNTGTAQEVEDVFQEGLLAMLTYCGRKDFTLNTPLGGLLYGICRRIWLKNLKKKRRSPITFQDLPEYLHSNHTVDVSEEELIDGERFRILKKNFNRLPPKGREVLNMFYTRNMSHEEIAEEAGYADAESAKVQKHKYLKRLRKWMREDPGSA